MNYERIERRFQGVVLILVFCSVNRDYGPLGQSAVLCLCLGYAIATEWFKSREEAKRKDHPAPAAQGE